MSPAVSVPKPQRAHGFELARAGHEARAGKGRSSEGAATSTPPVNLLGIEIDPVTEADAVAVIRDGLAAGRGGWVSTPNLDQLRRLAASTRLAQMVADADLVVADGMPLVWASRVKGTPLPERVAGSDMIWSLTAEAALAGRSIFLLGGAPGACEAAEHALRRCYPGARLAGSNCPPFGFERDAAAIDEIAREVRESAADIVYVALGFPKQEQLIQRLRGELPKAWFLGVGVSFSFLGGQVERAPDWMIRLGLEWLHRLAQEPRRLAKRYLVDGLPFAARLFAYAAACRMLRRELVPPRFHGRRFERPADDRARVHFHHGAIERRRASDLLDLLKN